jgi:hypothetical protein
MDPIIAVAEPRFSGPIIPHPVRANDRDKNIAVVESPFDIIPKVNADWRRIIIQEHDGLLLGSGVCRVLIMILQPVKYPPVIHPVSSRRYEIAILATRQLLMAPLATSGVKPVEIAYSRLSLGGASVYRFKPGDANLGLRLRPLFRAVLCYYSGRESDGQRRK